MAKMYEEMQAGITENELWSHLHQVNIARGGEWIETRLAGVGWAHQSMVPRMQRPHHPRRRTGRLRHRPDRAFRVLLGYQPHLVLRARASQPTNRKRIYRYAYDQVHYNMDIMKPGMSFVEIAEKSWKIPNEFNARRYGVLAHGVGLCDEYPHISFTDNADESSAGSFDPGMTICVESYIGAEDGVEGVKLEEQVLMTENGLQRLSTYPYEDLLLN